MNRQDDLKKIEQEFRNEVNEVVDKRIAEYWRLKLPVVSEPGDESQKKWRRLTFRVRAQQYGREPLINVIKTSLESLGFRWVSISPGERANGAPTYDVTVEVFASEKMVP